MGGSNMRALLLVLLLAGCIQMPPSSNASSKASSDADADATATASQTSRHGQGSIILICMQQNQGGAREAPCITPAKEAPGVARELLK